MHPRASALALALASVVVAAQDPKPAARTPAPPPARVEAAAPELRLRGPIKITAERADLENRESALYRGNVKLTSAELEMTGDRLELKQPAKGQYQARLSGRPARLRHKAEPEAQPVTASAQQIEYDTRTTLVQMSGGATLDRGTESISGDNISYNLAARRISASGTGKGQVQITIQPTQNNGPGGSNGSKRR